MWETEFDWTLDTGAKILVVVEGMVHAEDWEPNVFPLLLGFYIKPAAAGNDALFDQLKKEMSKIEEHAAIVLRELVDEEKRLA